MIVFTRTGFLKTLFVISTKNGPDLTGSASLSWVSVFATENVNQLNVDDDKNEEYRIVVATNYISLVYIYVKTWDTSRGDKLLPCMCIIVTFLLIFVSGYTFFTHTHTETWVLTIIRMYDIYVNCIRWFYIVPMMCNMDID